jgi:glycosyltransferase involved in cell wall biosynthesis
VIGISVNGRFLGQRITGAQRYARELLLAIDRCLLKQQNGDRFSLTVLLPRSTPAPPLSAGVSRTVGRGHGQLWEQLQLPRYVDGSVLLNLCNTAPITGRNMVATILDASVYAVPEAYSLAFRTWYRVMIPRVGQRAVRVITISEFSRGELHRYARIHPEKITVIPGSGEHILERSPDQAVLPRLGLGARPYVLAVSSQSKHKNLAGVIAAADLLGSVDFDLVLAGGGNSRVFSSVTGGAGERVRVAGYVTDAELRALYQSATCLLYPSLYEGFGLPPLEAMACGCPVITSRVASLPEVCGDAVLYCDPTEPGDIARATGLVLQDEGLRENLRLRGLERSAGFRWSDSADSMLRVLEGLPAQ